MGLQTRYSVQTVSLTTRSSPVYEHIPTQSDEVAVMIHSSFSKLELGLKTSYCMSLFSS